jgi:flagellar protein FlaI
MSSQILEKPPAPKTPQIPVTRKTQQNTPDVKEPFKKLQPVEKIKEELSDFKHYLHLLFKKKTVLEPYQEDKFPPLTTFQGIEGYTEQARYWVNKPYAFIVILYNEEKKEYLYHVTEPQLEASEWILLEAIYENLLDTLTPYDTRIMQEEGEDAKNKLLQEKTLELIDGYGIEVDQPALHKILYYIQRDYLGYGKIDALMKDTNIEDISCDGPDIPIFIYHRIYNSIKTNITFEEEDLDSFVMKLSQRCGKHISLGEPLINATLPDGSRLNASLGREITIRGSTFTIRKFREHAFTPADLIKHGTYSPAILAYLWLAVEHGKNILITGATAAGKTSTLNAISLFIPPTAKIVSIEDTHELVLHHTNWIGTVTRETQTSNTSNNIDMYELLRQALRQRPEYIIVGEIRGKEALTLFQAMSTGHTTFSTMHAESVHSVISRLEGDPINVPHVMMQALDLLCIQRLVQVNGKRMRRMELMVEFEGIDPATSDLRFNEIYIWDARTDSFKKGGRSSILQDIMYQRTWDEKTLRRELENREKLLEYMAEKDLDEYDIVALIQSYYTDPEKTMERLDDEPLKQNCL